MSLYKERTAKLAKKIIKELEEIGIHKIAHQENIKVIQGALDPDDNGKEPDVDKVLVNGEGTVYIEIKAFVNEVAFSDRVLDPEKFQTDTTIELAAPPVAEVMKRAIEEDIDRGWKF